MSAGAPLVLDARDAAAFARGHAPDAAHLWAGEWDARAHELPPREDPFLVVAGDEDEARALVARLHAGGHRAAAVAPPDVAADRREKGSPRRAPWRPSHWITECAPHLRPGARVLDVACGSGRNLVALAARGARGVGLDLLPDALDRARALAGRHGVALDLVVGDATRALPFREESFDLVTGFRYLDRALFVRLPASLRPGGELWWETFGAGQARFGHPKRPEFLLAGGELPALCVAAGLEVLDARDREDPGGHGPVLSSVRARKPGGRMLAGDGAGA